MSEQQPELNLSQVTTNWTRKPKIGEKVFQDGIEYKVVEEFLGFYYGKKKRARENTLLDPAKTKFLTEEKLSRDERIKILKDLVELDSIKENFQREIIILSKLIKKFPHREFWTEGFKPALKVSSLSYWYNRPEVEELYKKWALDLSSKVEPIKLEKEKVGEDIVVNAARKPKNLLDLLK